METFTGILVILAYAAAMVFIGTISEDILYHRKKKAREEIINQNIIDDTLKCLYSKPNDLLERLQSYVL